MLPSAFQSVDARLQLRIRQRQMLFWNGYGIQRSRIHTQAFARVLDPGIAERARPSRDRKYLVMREQHVAAKSPR
jgi:hypothetical protein